MSPVRLTVLSFAVCALSSCTSTFTNREQLAASVSHRIDRGRLFVTASVTNNSTQTVTFVKHPDFYSISVSAVDRSKDEAFHFPVISFVRATKDDLVVVLPGATATFTDEFRLRRPMKGFIDIVEDPWFLVDAPFMRIWDSRLQASFDYGKYPDYLPKRAWLLGRNYVMAEIGARTTFPRP